jgi:hypothetical protein
MDHERCANHPMTSAAANCASCSRGLCEECWRRNVDGDAWCERCIHHLTSSGRNVAVAVVFFLACAGFGVVAWKWDAAHDVEYGWLFWTTFVLGACGGALAIGTRKSQPIDDRISFRAAESTATPARPGLRRRYGAAMRHASMLLASPVSGLWTTVLVMVSMGVVVVALPSVLRLPRWVEAEGVIGAWWLIWSITLSTLLYRGWRLSDDHVLAPPRAPWKSDRMEPARTDAREEYWLWGCELPGCGEAGLSIFAIVAILAAVWLLVELLVPALFFVSYFLVRKSLARVANDHHGCEDDLPKAIAWGVFWASVYAVPLALAILVARQVLRHG